MTISEIGGGTKNDSEKLARFDLIPPEALWGLAELYGRGARKYTDRNWEKGINYSRIYRALQSHAWKFVLGEDFDPDDGQHHMDSVAWNAFALRTYEARGLGVQLDDLRIKK